MRIAHRSVVALTAAGALMLGSLPAHALKDDAVLTGAKSLMYPARSEGYLAWAQAPKNKPQATSVRAKAEPGGRAFKVNLKGTRAWMGGIDDKTLVYQQVKGGQSDIRLFNLQSRKHKGTPTNINTKYWEHSPDVSGEWILFGRFLENRRYPNKSKQHVRLIGLNGRNSRLIHKGGRNTVPGQVNGDYVVWQTWTRKKCTVFVYQISTQQKTKVPPGGKACQYSPSVDADGHVFYMSSGVACGSNVELRRWPVTRGLTQQIKTYSSKLDVASTYAYQRGGETEVVYTRARCKNGNLDVYELTELPAFA